MRLWRETSSVEDLLTDAVACQSGRTLQRAFAVATSRSGRRDPETTGALLFGPDSHFRIDRAVAVFGVYTHQVSTGDDTVPYSASVLLSAADRLLHPELPDLHSRARWSLVDAVRTLRLRTNRAVTALDPFEQHALRRAIRAGVTDARFAESELATKLTAGGTALELERTIAALDDTRAAILIDTELPVGAEIGDRLGRVVLHLTDQLSRIGTASQRAAERAATIARELAHASTDDLRLDLLRAADDLESLAITDIDFAAGADPWDVITRGIRDRVATENERAGDYLMAARVLQSGYSTTDQERARAAVDRYIARALNAPDATEQLDARRSRESDPRAQKLLDGALARIAAQRAQPSELSR